MKEKKKKLFDFTNTTNKLEKQLLNPKAKKLLEHILGICHYTVQGRLVKIPWDCLNSLLPCCPSILEEN